MPLTQALAVIRQAQREHYAVPLFAAFNSLDVDGIAAAAEGLQAPAIMAIFAGTLAAPTGRALAACVRTRAAESPVPIALMLDHGTKLEHCLQAIEHGFTDVMFDGSKLPLEENAARTREVVEAAHAEGVAVEGELGQVGSGRNYQEFGAQRAGFTDPETVKGFVSETGVDVLAVAIGSAHGQYQGEPHLDVELLTELRRRTEVPLSLHGGSGCAAEQFQAVIAAGIAKVNIATDLWAGASARMLETVRAGKTGYFDLTAAVVAGFDDRCRYYLEVFGAVGRG